MKIRSLSIVCAGALVLLAACGGDTNSTGQPADTSGTPPPDTSSDPADTTEPTDVETPSDTEAPDDPGAPNDPGPITPDADEDVAITPDPGTPPPDTKPPEDTKPEVPPADVTPDPSLCSAPGGDRNVYDLQNVDCPDHPSPEPTDQLDGLPVTLTGVRVTGVYGDTFFVQEPTGGAYSGIAVFSHGIPTDTLKVGATITVEGSYSEYFEASQVYLVSFEITDATTEPLAAFAVSHPGHVATGGELSELMEGVLLRVSDVKTIHTKPDCPNDYGEFMVTGELRVDDKGVAWDARLGDLFESITGPLHFAFGNTKLEPRTDADIAWTKKGGATSLSKCIESDCQVPATTPGSKQLVVNEIMGNPFATDTGKEWVELYNPTAMAVDIAGWEIRDCGDQVFVLMGPLAPIPPGGFVVVGGSTDPASNGGAPITVGWGDGFYLPNTVGSVLIFDGSGFAAQLVDQTRYSAFEPWEVFGVGHSIERKSPTSDGTLPTSWLPGSKTYDEDGNQGSPAKVNDLALE